MRPSDMTVPAGWGALCDVVPHRGRSGWRGRVSIVRSASERGQPKPCVRLELPKSDTIEEAFAAAEEFANAMRFENASGEPRRPAVAAGRSPTG